MTAYSRITLLLQFCSSFLLFLSLATWGAPGFSSNPPPTSANQSIFVGEAAIGHPITTDINISEVGDELLQLFTPNNNPLWSGVDAQEFKLLTPLPINIENNTSVKQLVVQCIPQNANTRTATLNFETNDSNNSEVSYNFSCTGLPNVADYKSQPTERRGVFITTNGLGKPGTAGIEFFELGTKDLMLDKPFSLSGNLLEGPHANEFKVLTPLPLVIADGKASQTLVVQCNPTLEGLRTATLKLDTNIPNTPKLFYPLGCIGNYTADPEFTSFPETDTDIEFTQTRPGKPTRAWLTLLNQGESTKSPLPLSVVKVSNAKVTGAHATEFALHLLDSRATLLTYNETQLLPIQDFDLVGESLPRQLAITCTPNDVGERTATLNLETSDPNYSAVNYQLSCPSSEDVPPSDIILSNMVIKEAEVEGTLVGVLETLDENTNDTHTYALLDDSNGLVRLSGNNVVLAQTAIFSSKPYSIKIRSMDSTGSTLEKIFNIRVQSNVKFDAKVFSETRGILVDAVNTSELFTLTGIIEPSPVHENLNAQLEVVYTYTDPSNTSITLPPINLGRQALPNPSTPIEVQLYKGNLLFLPGTINVELSYILDSGEKRSGLAKSLIIAQNSAPTDIELSAQQVAENSPVGSLVGTLETIDDDQGDTFIYALVDNPGTPFGYFEIVGDELRIANSFPVNFEDTPSLTLTLRSIDAAGKFVDKAFTLEVTNEIEAQFFGELRSAGTLLPNSPDTVPTVQGDRPLTLTTRILPEPSHIGKAAEIYYAFNFVNVFVENTLPPLDGVLESNVILTERMDYTVFDSILTELSGTAQIQVGYRLLDGSFDGNDIIAAFNIKAKTSLQQSWNTLSHPLCNGDYTLPNMLDLSTLPVDFTGSVLLEQINAIPTISEANLVVQQDALNNTLFVEAGGLRMAWWPLLLRQDHNVLDASIAISPRQILKLVTSEQLEIIAQPAVHHLCALQTALSENTFRDLQVSDNGNIHATIDDENFISMRADVLLLDTEQVEAGFSRLADSLALLVLLDTDGTLKQQLFYASPAWPEQLAANVTNLVFTSPQQLSFDFDGVRYTGIPALQVKRATFDEDTFLQIETQGDENADGVDDFEVLYNNGDKQLFYGIAP